MGEKEAVENMVGACEEGVSRGDMMECDLEDKTGYEALCTHTVFMTLPKLIKQTT